MIEKKKQSIKHTRNYQQAVGRFWKDEAARSSRQVNIPPARSSHDCDRAHLTRQCFSLMRTDVEALFPTEITQKTCRIKSHLSRGIGLCTAVPEDWTAAWHHFTDGLQSGGNSKSSLVTHFLAGRTVGTRISNRAGQTLQRRDIGAKRNMSLQPIWAVTWAHFYSGIVYKRRWCCFPHTAL